MWSTRAELETALLDAGLGEWASRLAQLARHSIILVPAPVEQGAAAPPGASRLGGEPDLPPDVDWPMRSPLDVEDAAGSVPGRVLIGRGHWLHRLFRTQRWKEASQAWERTRHAERYIRGRAWPLSFVAQIDFAELYAIQPLEGFPPAGRLLLFCDPFDLPCGTREDQARVSVIFTEEPAERLRRRPHPQEFDEPAARSVMPRGYVFKPRRLRPAAWLLPPPPGPVEQPRAARWPAQETYDQFWRDLFAQHPKTFRMGGDAIHQVGGFAFSIQEPVEAECTKFAEHNPGPSRWDSNDVSLHAPTPAQPAWADEWQLVLQIDSDIEAGMQWGDVGRLYLCARRQDLAARRFDRCWMITQCY